MHSVATSEGTENGAPSSPTWRRERLLRIGSNSTLRAGPSNGDVASSPVDSISGLPIVTETSSLYSNEIRRSYGTLPSRRRKSKGTTFASRRGLPQPPALNVLHRTASNPASPHYIHSTLKDLAFGRLSSARPISAYDNPDHINNDEPEPDVKTNGIRVWYSSFTSIDWLHDAIKDSVRFSKLRKHKSIRSRIRLAFDKSLGWLVVTIVGFLTAVVAFLIIRSEQWLFDTKDGYCASGWWKAKRYCCPLEDTGGFHRPRHVEDTCQTWKTWSDVFSYRQGDHGENIVDYISYACIALTLALISCLLTLYLTNSTTFVTRKESGVQSIHPGTPDDVKDQMTPTAGPKRKIMYYAAGSGIPEIKTILSGFVIHGYLGGRVLFTKSVGLALSVASGLSLGKEGPFVHIASCIGNIVSRITAKYENNEAKRREILSAACAAGVAVAFGAPIGGTLFSLEEVSYFFPPKVMWRSFFCAMIAAITLKMLDPFGTGKLVLFQVTYDKDWHGYELVPFLILGLFGGVYGAYFSKLNYRWSKHVRNKTWLGKHPIVEVLLITLLTSIFCFLNPYTRMGGTELVYELFAECQTGKTTHSGLCVVNPGSFEHAWPVVQAILIAMVVKGALTVVTFGIKLPAGIFIPTLGVGACAGRVLGIGMQWLQMRNPDAQIFRSCGGDLDCIVPGLYAMVGAAATLSGVTRTTVSLAVIMFELTDTLTYAVPVMLSVLVAKTVADALEPKGIYDLVIELNQLPYLDYKHEYIWGHLQISEVTSRDVPVIIVDEENTVKNLGRKLLALTSSGADDSGFPILRQDRNDDGLRMVGYIGTNELEHALSILADNENDAVHFHVADTHALMSSSILSFAEAQEQTLATADPFNFTPYMDQAPLTISNNSPLELLHQFFTKLGARYVIVTDTDGLYEGVIEKKTWLAFVADLEEKS